MRKKNKKFPNIGKKHLVFFLAVILSSLPVVTAVASTLEEAKDKKNEAQQALDETEANIGYIEYEQQELQEEINALDAELVQVILNLSILEEDLAKKEVELQKVQEDLVVAQENEADQYEKMKKRIRFMYERGDTAILTAILESMSISDLLNRVEYVNQIYESDRELLVDFQEAKQMVADLKIQVQGEIAEMEEMQVNYQEEQARYETMIAEKKGKIEDFDSQLAEARVLAEAYQETINRQNEIIRQEEERIRREEEERRRREEERRRQEEQRQREEEQRRREEEERRQQEAANNASNSNSSSSSNNSDSSSSSSNSQSSSSSSNTSSSSSSSSSGNLNPSFSTGVSGGSIVDYACQFIGNKYVWGGTDPNTGADCSGFVQYVYRQFGISLPRTSWEQRNAGKEVSYSNAQPGDLICYSGHVAIYMGNGQIVHASSSAPYPTGGIKTGNATYRTIIGVRRVL